LHCNHRALAQALALAQILPAGLGKKGPLNYGQQALAPRLASCYKPARSNKRESRAVVRFHQCGFLSATDTTETSTNRSSTSFHAKLGNAEFRRLCPVFCDPFFEVVCCERPYDARAKHRVRLHLRASPPGLLKRQVRLLELPLQPNQK